MNRHLIICCAANTLLLLQEDIISSLPDYKRREINRKVELIRLGLSYYVVIGGFHIMV